MKAAALAEHFASLPPDADVELMVGGYYVPVTPDRVVTHADGTVIVTAEPPEVRRAIESGSYGHTAYQYFDPIEGTKAVEAREKAATKAARKPRRAARKAAKAEKAPENADPAGDASAPADGEPSAADPAQSSEGSEPEGNGESQSEQ